MRALAAALTAAGLAGVAACGRYEPRPIDPTVHPAAYRVRRLDDPALAAWLGRYAGAPVDGRWSARQLGLVALAHRADVERARREWLAA
ncbi:MAG TPA: hypothetical protein VFT84_11565, partial [Gemmatimonadales bacterium]|nr:hypothetical protein [Gemmatimonadales bacterium]